MANREIKDFAAIVTPNGSDVLHINTGVDRKIEVSDLVSYISGEILVDASLSQKGVVQLGNTPVIQEDDVAATVGFATDLHFRIMSAEDLLENFVLYEAIGGDGLTNTAYDDGVVTINMGTPTTLTTSTTNNVTTTSHTHQVNFPVTSVAGETGDVVLEMSHIVDAGTAASATLVTSNADTTGSRVPTVEWVNANTVTNANQLYRGPWEAQSGNAVPPYWVDYGGGENAALQSEDLDTTWESVRLEPVSDSGIAAPTIDGESFGNYWGLTPTTEDGAHRLWQPITAPSSGKVSFLARGNGYNFLYVKLFPDSILGLGLASFRVDLTDGSVIDISNVSVSVQDKGSGSYLIEASWTDIPGILKLYLDVQQDGNASFPGNGTDGILVTRVQVAHPNARYVKTTDTAAPYTPPTIYGLQKYQSDVTATTPGTDETVWKEIGSGGGGGGATGPYSIVPSVELSANDQDGSGNISVTLDLSEGTVWTIDCTNAPLMSTSGNIDVTVTGLPADPNTGITFQVYFKRAGRKGVNWMLPAGVTASWAGAQSYGPLASSVDVVQGYWLSSDPSIMNFSIIDKR